MMKQIKFVFVSLVIGLLLTSCGLVENILDGNYYENSPCFNDENNCDDFYDNEDFNNENENEEYMENDENSAGDDPADNHPNNNEENPSSGTMTTLEILPVSSSAPAAHSAFDKYVDVFGVSIYATRDLSDAKVLHAAAVMAEYLDNDEDGIADNAKVIAAMQANNATLILFATENKMESFIDALESSGGDPGQGYQPLFEFEIDMSGSGFDATLEEVLHIITQYGYADAYPEVWGERRGTGVADAMDLARGGYFASVPSSYPAGAWYTYDDRTCEYECMIAEYTYWALTSLLGGQDGPGRLDEIGHEWPLNTADKVKSGDPTMYALLTDPANGMPTRLPDGHYAP